MRPETDPVGLMNLVGIFPADGHGGVGAARIQNDDFVNPLDRLQTRPDIDFFVFGNNGYGKVRFHQNALLKTP